MAELKITRGGAHMSVLSKFQMSVDGEDVGKLGHGKSLTVDVAPGSHNVHVHSLGTDGGTDVDVPESGLDLVVGYKTSVGKSLGGAAVASAKGGKGGKPQVEFWVADED